jgi:hypothetical protein
MSFGLPFNSVRFSDLLIFEQIEAVTPPYNSLSLSSDLLWDFDYRRADDYDLFNVRYAVLPAQLAAPSFLAPIARTQRYVLYGAPSTGYAEYVTSTRREAVGTSTALVRANRPWVLAADRAQRGFIQWDYPASTIGGAPSLPACAGGTTRDEAIRPGRLDVRASCGSAGTLLLKVTYDPGWRVTIDGAPADTVMLSPAYLGVVVPAGSHAVAAKYTSAPAKTPLLILGLLALVAAVPITRRLRFS